MVAMQRSSAWRECTQKTTHSYFITVACVAQIARGGIWITYWHSVYCKCLKSFRLRKLGISPSLCSPVLLFFFLLFDSLPHLLTLFVCSFPSCHFGKLYGLVMALSAVFSVMQYPCFALVNGVLHGDPLYVSTWQVFGTAVNFTYLLWSLTFLSLLLMCPQVNIALTLLSMVAFIHPLSVYLHCQRLASQRNKNQDSS